MLPGNADLLLCCLMEGVHHLIPPVKIAYQPKIQGTENSLDHHRHVGSQHMFGMSKQVDSVQSEELEFDSITDIQSLVFFKHIDVFKMHGLCNSI